MTTENKQPEVAVLDIEPLAKLVAFMGMNFDKIVDAAGYSYGTERPATLNRVPDIIDEIMADRRPLVQAVSHTENTGLALFMRDVVAAQGAYLDLAEMFNKELKVPGGGNDVSDVEMNDGPDSEDGCDSEGFKGGCGRMGHTPETCPNKPEADVPGDSHTLSVFSHPSWNELRTVAMRHKDVFGLEATRKFLADNGVNKVADLPYSSVDEVIVKLNTILREHGES